MASGFLFSCHSEPGAKPGEEPASVSFGLLPTHSGYSYPTTCELTSVFASPWMNLEDHPKTITQKRPPKPADPNLLTQTC
jgi:hypothetical protein